MMNGQTTGNDCRDARSFHRDGLCVLSTSRGEIEDAKLTGKPALNSHGAHNDQLTRVTTHVPARFRSIHRWFPRACLGVESSAEENVVL
jgi:hypothetical protein